MLIPVKWVKQVRYNFLYLLDSTYNNIIQKGPTMPLTPRLASVSRAITLLSVFMSAPIANAATQHCNLEGAREIGTGSNTLFIANNPAFDPYHYVLVDPVYIDSRHVLSDLQKARLRTTFKHAIEQDWQERLGWRSSQRAGDHVLRLNIHINDIVVDSNSTDTSMVIDMSLTDSLTGERLMARCNETLNVSPQVAAIDGIDGLFWNHLQNSVKHWGAGLGSHIMTPY